ncbi:MAG TPA: type IV toxin-antitoxin system AbiEi family antitoxin domain-containing protein [Ilumatobacter sp.]|nr:type IV toxin-antitoxin system AbiEi family antitoxin domain-containing protein [Ilumatobacter sp.]
MTNATERLMALATGQLGAFTRTQANDHGLSDRQLRSRVQSGFLIQSGPNSFRVAGAPNTLMAELTALVLDIGQPVWVSGPTAAALHRFDGYHLHRPFHLIVPRERSLTRWNARLHRSDTIEPIDRGEVNGLPVLSATRTVIDLARTASSSQLAAALDSGVRDGLLSEDLLHRRAMALRSQGRHGIPLLAEVIAGAEVTRGGHSWLEREYLRLLAEAGLPAPGLQQILSRARDRLVRVDCRFPGTNVVVELLGYRYHRSRQDMTRDAARANALMSDGFRPYQFTYEHIVTDRHYVVATTAAALADRDVH